ncbi:hypothetical protein QJQ45_022108 [Haematococcus lacustris]|nr:hypothetical protein QJQ45_022108 [Haematococcus lacustris]
MDLLDVRGAGKKIWLVKVARDCLNETAKGVPQSVAQVWRPLCELALNPANFDEDAPNVQLGSLQIGAVSAESRQPEITLRVSGPATARGPRTFQLTRLVGAVPGTCAGVSFRPNEEGEPSQIRVEGTVTDSFNAMPIAALDDKGQVLVDEQYRALNRSRTEKAEVNTHPIQALEHNRRQNLELLRSKRAAVATERLKPEDAKKRKEERKRTSADPKVLETELFKLFARQPSWPFAQLQAETQQPGPHLKSVLETQQDQQEQREQPPDQQPDQQKKQQQEEEQEEVQEQRQLGLGGHTSAHEELWCTSSSSA